jgi:hypothetical protein
MTDLQASIQLLELVGRFFRLPIKNCFSSNKIDEITQDLETKRKELEKDLDNSQPHLEIAEIDKSIYI